MHTSLPLAGFHINFKLVYVPFLTELLRDLTVKEWNRQKRPNRSVPTLSQPNNYSLSWCPSIIFQEQLFSFFSRVSFWILETNWKHPYRHNLRVAALIPRNVLCRKEGNQENDQQPVCGGGRNRIYGPGRKSCYSRYKQEKVSMERREDPMSHRRWKGSATKVWSKSAVVNVKLWES